MDKTLEKLVEAWMVRTGPAPRPGTDIFGDSVELHRLRRALKTRSLRLRGVDDRRLRRWRRRYDSEFAARRRLAKAVCLGLGYGMGRPV